MAEKKSFTGGLSQRTRQFGKGLGCVTTLLFVSCGPQSSPLKSTISLNDGQGIRGGEAVDAADQIAHSTVALYLKIPDSERIVSFCTGTLIGERTVLTAGHCLLSMSESTQLRTEEILPLLRVGFGLGITESENASNIQFRSVAQGRVHSDFSLAALENIDPHIAIPDLALLQLSERAPAGYSPARYLTDQNKIIPGLELTLAGYGLTEVYPSEVPATELREVKVRVTEAHFNPSQFSFDILGGKGSCSGDSGGPAYMMDSRGHALLVGVTSFGDQICDRIGVYTSVPSQLAWIEKGLLDYEPSPGSNVMASISGLNQQL